jgi:hypothetical protein
MFDKYKPGDLVWVYIPDEPVAEGQVLSRRLKMADGSPAYRVDVEDRPGLSDGFCHESILRPRRVGEPRPRPRWWQHRAFPNRE